MSAYEQIHIGDPFGKWTVIDVKPPREKYDPRTIVCQCRCGKIQKMRPDTLLRRGSESCLRCRPSGRLIHGHTSKHHVSPTYRSWASVIQRCTNPHNPAWKYYGGKGIRVCDRWMEFANFLTDMGERTGLHYSIERRRNDRGYYKDNCHWILKSLQARNLTTNHILIVDGEAATMAEWADRYNIPYNRLCARLLAGWDVIAALTLPPHTRQKGLT